MLIENLRLVQVGGKLRLTADLVYERVMRPFRSIFFEVEQKDASWLQESYHPFILAALLPAWWHGESRLLINGQACPMLVENLKRLMAWHAHWYEKKRPPPDIVYRPLSRPTASEAARKSAMFFTGGVDSMYTLFDTWRMTPASHPARITAGIMVYGLEVRKADAFTAVLDNAVSFGNSVDLEIVQVATNFAEIEDDYDFWMKEYAGAGFGAVAHALAGGIHTCYLASSFDLPNLDPWALHPATDPLLSSATLEVRHHGIDVARVAKIAALAEDRRAIANLRVCSIPPAGMVNCGKCEKCLRTMMGLLVAGALQDAVTFPAREVTADAVRRTRIRSETLWAFNRELLGPLARIGRDDLVEALRDNYRKMKALERWRGDRGIRGAARKVLRRMFA